MDSFVCTRIFAEVSALVFIAFRREDESCLSYSNFTLCANVAMVVMAWMMRKFERTRHVSYLLFVLVMNAVAFCCWIFALGYEICYVVDNFHLFNFVAMILVSVANFSFLELVGY
jgi:hypothetical protein